ncbi:2-polyprenylphenol 6-hydroxylase [Candidatus Liberibacter sp.]|uniref:2-polyprenylphenol 6-hydroxylase n=1 Tax=Candidatus Liberibacter sp. TaxID=34022 RepID=UPI0015F6CB81|nr:2-polyprenylphenol 6-hydroxylase [Candidatus Liberibacter sp.]MBA5723693.1 2-polyprenylphenol 6-hydroxylase [Candidatus Liberibacter sp.]
MGIFFRGYYDLLRISWVLVREGILASLPPDRLPLAVVFIRKVTFPLMKRKARNFQRSDRLARALGRLGPSYVKMGQFLATRPDIVGKRFSEDLSLLQDRMDFFPTDIAKLSVSSVLGRPVEELYCHFDDPIAAASLAQVHPAFVEDAKGRRKVAVKIIRPGIRKRFSQDIQTMYLVARIQGRFVPSMRRLRLLDVTNTLEHVTKMEMDLRLEAAAFSELAENTAKDKGFRVPTIDWNRTGRDVITMEWIDGIRISDVEQLRAAGNDLKHLSVSLVQSFLLHTLRDGFFHADMHPGNLFVDSKGSIVAVDMGITGRLGKRERRFLAEIIYGFISRNYQHVADIHFEAGYIPPHHSPASFAQAIRAIGEPIHGQSSEAISMGKLLTMLFEITELFDMMARPELIMLQKTMVVVEGVARMLDPEFNMWVTSEPVVADWLRNHVGPKSQMYDLRDGIKTAMRFVQAAPNLAVPVEKVAKAFIEVSEREDFLDCLKRESPKNTGRFLERVALWTAVFALIYVVSGL